ncbi:MAG TPA: addiction module protein [Acidiferrobacterales bacterium]|jgi:hypothetical protein
MARTIEDIERDIRLLSRKERRELLKTLIAELDTPSDPGAERAWLETCQRRYKELVEGKVAGIPGPLVFERLRTRLGG